MERFVFFFIISCISCSNLNDEIVLEKYEIVDKGLVKLSDTLSIKIDEYTDPLLPHILYKEIDGYDKLIYGKKGRVIVLHDINSGDLDSINYFAEGPNRIAGSMSFFVHNYDSIFYLSENMLKEVSLHDRKGNLINKWNFDEKDEDSWMGDFDFYQFKYNPKLNEIYFWTVAGHVKDMYSRKTYQQYAFNIKTQEKREIGYIPDLYIQNNYYPFDMIASCITDSLLINFYPPINQIFISDLRTDSVRALTLSIPSFGEPSPVLSNKKKSDLGLSAEKKYLIESNYFYKMISNEDNTVYYLFYKKGIPFVKLDGSETSMLEYDFGVVVFDRNLMPITFFEPEKPANYYSHMSFAMGEKLFISLNNPLNKDFDEDYFKFAVFQINK